MNPSLILHVISLRNARDPPTFFYWTTISYWTSRKRTFQVRAAQKWRRKLCPKIGGGSCSPKIGGGNSDQNWYEASIPILITASASDLGLQLPPPISEPSSRLHFCAARTCCPLRPGWGPPTRDLTVRPPFARATLSSVGRPCHV